MQRKKEIMQPWQSTASLQILCRAPAKNLQKRPLQNSLQRQSLQRICRGCSLCNEFAEEPLQIRCRGVLCVTGMRQRQELPLPPINRGGNWEFERGQKGSWEERLKRKKKNEKTGENWELQRVRTEEKMTKKNWQWRITRRKNREWRRNAREKLKRIREKYTKLNFISLGSSLSLKTSTLVSLSLSVQSSDNSSDHPNTPGSSPSSPPPHQKSSGGLSRR